MCSAASWQQDPESAGLLRAFRNVQSPRHPIATGAVYAPSDMLPVDPFEVPDADMHGAVSEEVSAELLQLPQSTVAAGRALLHGSAKLRKYSKCNSCRMVSCSRSAGFCSGHCRRNKKLFFCSSNTVPFPNCFTSPEPVTLADVQGRPPDDLNTYDTAVVSVPRPYIGCAMAGNRPSGCPRRGTKARLPERKSAKVVRTRCRAEYYIPECLSPLIPFGVCECVYEIDVSAAQKRKGRRGDFVTAPCRTTELSAGAGVGGPGGTESETGLDLVHRGSFTETWFSNFTVSGQEPDFTYNVTATSRAFAADVDVSLSIFRGVVVNTDTVGAREVIPEDFDHESEVPDEQPVTF